ncbi:MAG: ribonuclease E inhibitor RraB [Roseivirga sp.]|nr:ribonuclease E inhibitor RraB [Roseivirga sp.]
MSFLDRFKKHKITNENWEFYQTIDEEENVTFATIDLTYQEPQNQKGFEGELFVRIRIPQNRLHEGIAIPEEHEYQNLKEEELCARLVKSRINCIQVGRLAFEGQKQYIFEHNDFDGFKSEFNKWGKTFSDEYSLELKPLKPFEYYSDLLPDKYIWQQIGNRHVIEQLLAAGSDESKEHYIEHGIFGKPDDLKNLFEEIREHNISLIGIEGDLMEVGIKSSIELDDITNQTDYLIEITETYNCRYDGWNTAIVK